MPTAPGAPAARAAAARSGAPPPRGAPLGPSLPGARAGGRSGDGAVASGPDPSLPARPARRGRVPPAGGAGAGLALPIGAGESGTLPPPRPRSAPRTHPGGRRDAKPAPRSLAASPRRAGNLAARPGRDRRKTRSSSEGTNLGRAREKGQRTRGRQGWWRLAPRAPPAPAPPPPRPAAWPGARRCCCCAPRPSGWPPRSCSACPGPQVGPAAPARRLGAGRRSLALSGLRLRGCAPGLSPEQGATRRAPPRPARLGPAPHRSGCFQ